MEGSVKERWFAKLAQNRRKITVKREVADIRKGEDIELKEILFERPTQNGYRVHVKNVTFRKCLFTRETISEVIFQNCRFDECQFVGTIIDNCEFHQCRFIESCFFKARISRTYIDPSSFKFSWKWYRHWSNVNAWWFHALYQNSKECHQERFSRIADQRFQFYRRYESLFGKNKRPFFFLGSLFYDMALGCGYGIMNALFCTCILIGGFSALIHSKTSLSDDSGVIEHLYFAIVSFTTVGYGEVTPAHNTTALLITTLFLFVSFVWGAIVAAVIIKRLVK